MFFSLRLGRKQRAVLAAVCCGAVLILAGSGLAGRAGSRSLRQDQVLPVSAGAAEEMGETDASLNAGRLAFLQGLGYKADKGPEDAVGIRISEHFDDAY